MWRIAWLGAKGVRWGAGSGSGPGTNLQQTEARQDRLGWCEGAKARESAPKGHKLVCGQLGLAQGGNMTRTGQRTGQSQGQGAKLVRARARARARVRARGPGPGPRFGP